MQEGNWSNEVCQLASMGGSMSISMSIQQQLTFLYLGLLSAWSPWCSCRQSYIPLELNGLLWVSLLRLHFPYDGCQFCMFAKRGGKKNYNSDIKKQSHILVLQRLQIWANQAKRITSHFTDGQWIHKFPCNTLISAEKCNQNHAYFECVCLVILRMVAPSLPMMAPTNWVGTSMRSGMSDCSLGRVTREGEAWRSGPRGAPPLLLPTAGGSESAVSSGM